MNAPSKPEAVPLNDVYIELHDMRVYDLAYILITQNTKFNYLFPINHGLNMRISIRIHTFLKPLVSSVM